MPPLPCYQIPKFWMPELKPGHTAFSKAARLGPGHTPSPLQVQVGARPSPLPQHGWIRAGLPLPLLYATRSVGQKSWSPLAYYIFQSKIRNCRKGEYCLQLEGHLASISLQSNKSVIYCGEEEIFHTPHHDTSLHSYFHYWGQGWIPRKAQMLAWENTWRAVRLTE